MEALLFVLLCPVGSYYGGGSFEAVSLYADEKAVRAWPGGAGSCKLGANYAPTVARQVEAAENNCVQVSNIFIFIVCIIDGNTHRGKVAHIPIPWDENICTCEY